MNLKINNWPYFDEEQILKVGAILRSGKVNYWSGNEGKSFESEFAEWCGVKHALTMANGTVSLVAAYKSLGLKKGDYFITTPRSFVATASSGVLLGAQPIFADVDLDSGNITADSIEPLITEKTKIISVVHLGGWPAEMKKICDLANKYKLKVVEDCAQAHGALIDNKSVGGFGDISSWSFCQDKIISTGGEGGMLSTDNIEIFKEIRSYRDHGKNIESLFKSKSQLNGEFKYIHDTFGTNYRLSEIQSSLGRIQLRKLKNWTNKRTANAEILIECLKELNNIRIPLPNKNLKHAWYKFYVYLKSECLSDEWSRNRIIREINSAGFPAFSGSCSEIYLEKSFKYNLEINYETLPNARNLGENSLMFLVHPTISFEQMNEYASTIKKVLIKSKKI